MRVNTLLGNFCPSFWLSEVRVVFLRLPFQGGIFQGRRLQSSSAQPGDQLHALRRTPPRSLAGCYNRRLENGSKRSDGRRIDLRLVQGEKRRWVRSEGLRFDRPLPVRPPKMRFRPADPVLLGAQGDNFEPIPKSRRCKLSCFYLAPETYLHRRIGQGGRHFGVGFGLWKADLSLTEGSRGDPACCFGESDGRPPAL